MLEAVVKSEAAKQRWLPGTRLRGDHDMESAATKKNA
jgi:hypothetical protein